jgi:glucans biosynthesis protein
MHGGAAGSGAPNGNHNALKDGRYTKAAIEERRALRRLIRDAEEFLEEV